MFGAPPDDGATHDGRGIIPRAAAALFAALRVAVGIEEVSIRMSFLEIYQEIVKDLLNPGNLKLRIRERPDESVFVEGLMESYVTSERDIFALLARGEAQRSVSATQMNERSSRSHTLLLFTVQQRAADGSVRVGRLNFADLAGSEKARRRYYYYFIYFWLAISDALLD